MKYNDFIRELEYWKRVSGEENPEIVINTPPYSHIIDEIRPVRGVENVKAIGIILEI